MYHYKLKTLSSFFTKALGTITIEQKNVVKNLFRSLLNTDTPDDFPLPNLTRRCFRPEISELDIPIEEKGVRKTALA